MDGMGHNENPLFNNLVIIYFCDFYFFTFSSLIMGDNRKDCCYHCSPTVHHQECRCCGCARPVPCGGVRPALGAAEQQRWAVQKTDGEAGLFAGGTQQSTGLRQQRKNPHGEGEGDTSTWSQWLCCGNNAKCCLEIIGGNRESQIIFYFWTRSE